MFHSKRKILYVIGLSLLFLSGCAEWKERGVVRGTEGNDNQSITINLPQTSEADKVKVEGEDAWGLNDIMELFDMWECCPSDNPTSLEEIANMAGYPQKYVTEQIRNAENVLIMLPKMKVESQGITFYAEESKKQFLNMEWNKYIFNEVKTIVFNSNSQGLWGYAYLCNSLQKWMDEKPAVFISYYYQFEIQQLEIMEIVEATEEIINYAYILDYESDAQRGVLCAEAGIRLLNPEAELNPYEKVLPVPELTGKELEKYIALVFLDIVRNPDNLEKYEKVITEESISLLQQLDGYYQKPEEIYDFAKFWNQTETKGDIIISSQFQPTLWGNILLDIDIQFAYDNETGKISVEEGNFVLAEKP